MSLIKKIFPFCIIMLMSLNLFAVIIGTDNFNYKEPEFEWDIRALTDDGNTLNNYNQDNFKLFYTAVADAEVIHDKEPAGVAVILDRSKSLRGHEEKSRELFFEAISLIPENSHRVYCYFNNRINFFKTIEDAEPDTYNLIEELEFKGSTAFYDSLYYAAEELQTSPLQKKFVFVITDGIDEVNIGQETRMSKFGLEHVINKLKEDNIKVLALLPQNQRVDMHTLSKITSETEGEIFENIEQAKEFVSKNLRDRFSVIVDDPFLFTDARTREVTISINRKGDTLNLEETINIKKSDRFFPETIDSRLDSFKVNLEEVISKHPLVTFTAYGYENGENIKGPDLDDIRASIKTEIIPFDFEFIFDPSCNLILVDKSGSMQSQWEEVLNFLKEFVNQKNYYDTFSLITFDSRPYVFSKFGSNIDVYLFGDRVRPRGSTAFYDSLIFSSMKLHEVKGQKSIIAFTDGIDQRYEGDVQPVSKHDLKKARGILVNRGIPFYAVNFSEEARVDLLKELALYTGGGVFINPTQKSVEELYNLINRNKAGFYRFNFRRPVISAPLNPELVQIFLIDDDIIVDSEEELFKIGD
ncbi:MAG: VWA domain-containing protein [Candidatus Muiribacteriota bacterium]